MIDHVVWVVPHLGTTAHAIAQDWGVEPTPGGAHPTHGTHNALLRLGPRSYLEILAADPTVDPASRSARGHMVAGIEVARVHEILLSGADAQTPTAEYRITGIFPGTRANADGRNVRWQRTELETATGAKLPDLIEWVSEAPTHDLPAGVRMHRCVLSTCDAPADIARALMALGAPDVEVVDGPPGYSIELETPNGLVSI